MRILALAPLLSVLALAGCAHSPDVANAEAGMSWALGHTDSEGAKLVLGAPGTDDVDVMLTCLPKSGQVKVFLTGPMVPLGAAHADFALRSGGATVKIRGTQLGDMEDLFGARVAADDPALAGFAHTGEMTVVVGRRDTALPPAGTLARTFVDGCRR